MSKNPYSFAPSNKTKTQRSSDGTLGESIGEF